MKLKDFDDRGKWFIYTDPAERQYLFSWSFSIYKIQHLGSPKPMRLPSFLHQTHSALWSQCLTGFKGQDRTHMVSSFVFIYSTNIDWMSVTLPGTANRLWKKTTVILLSTLCHLCTWYTIQTVCMWEDVFFLLVDSFLDFNKKGLLLALFWH